MRIRAHSIKRKGPLPLLRIGSRGHVGFCAQSEEKKTRPPGAVGKKGSNSRAIPPPRPAGMENILGGVLTGIDADHLRAVLLKLAQEVGSERVIELCVEEAGIRGEQKEQ